MHHQESAGYRVRLWIVPDDLIIKFIVVSAVVPLFADVEYLEMAIMAFLHAEVRSCYLLSYRENVGILVP